MERNNDLKFKNESWKPKVLVTHTQLPDEALNYLRPKCDLSFAKSKERGDILKKVKGVDGLLWASLERLDAEILDAAGPQLKSISVKSAGLDYVDVAEIKKRNISLGYTPILPSEPTGEIAIGLALAAARRFHEGRLNMEKDQWQEQPQTFLGVEIRDSVIGIVGFGGIGQAIAKDIRGFAPQEIIYSGRSEKPEAEKLEAKFVSFEELVEKSDFVFITCPLTSETTKMFNAAVFDKMKPTSVLVNVARGDIVDQEALYDALKYNKIFAAGLDVMTPEPLPSDHPLMSLPNCG
jgi:glyoxylate/hydroxypyruvate reductase